MSVWQDEAGDFWYGAWEWDTAQAELTALRAENERLRKALGAADLCPTLNPNVRKNYLDGWAPDCESCGATYCVDRIVHEALYQSPLTTAEVERVAKPEAENERLKRIEAAALHFGASLQATDPESWGYMRNEPETKAFFAALAEEEG